MLSIDSLFESSKMLVDYLTKNFGYNLFLIDEIDSQEVVKLRKAIDENNKVEAVHQYLKLDKQMDAIRDKYCYNNPELPYRSSFRTIAKELYLEIKKNGLLFNEDFKYIGKVLRFISTSDYYIIRDFLIRRSLPMCMYWNIELNPDNFYCGYIPLEVFMDYAIKMYRIYMKDM